MRVLAAMSLLALLISGCNSSGSVPPVPVSGKVTLEGKPVEGAIVTFLTKTGEGRSASGKTGADGAFKLTSINTNDGAPPGDYIITIAKTEMKGADSGGGIDISKGDYGAAYGAAMAAAASGNMSKVQKDLLPKKYASAADSGLTRTVVKGDANDFLFDL